MICITCQIEKTTDSFGKDKYTKTGFRTQCKECILARKGRIKPKEGFKFCSKCKIEKELANFYFSNRTGKYLWGCKECHGELTKNRRGSPARLAYHKKRNATPEEKAYQKEWNIKKHGLTLEIYNSMLKSQDYKCAICRTDKPGGRGGFQIDHDHKCCQYGYSCGKCVRGLLCYTCNAGMGYLKDDAARILKAYTYLINYSNRNTDSV